MHWLFALVALIYSASVAAGEVFYGKGELYITQSVRGNKSLGLRVTYRPEDPRNYFIIIYKAYLGLKMEQALELDRAKNNLNATRYDGWNEMELETKGRYYYVDNFPGILATSYFAYGVDILDLDEKIYEHTIQAGYVNKRSSYCELDGQSTSANDYLCSQALNGEPRVTTPKTTTTTEGDENDNSSTPKPIPWAIIIPNVLFGLSLSCSALGFILHKCTSERDFRHPTVQYADRTENPSINSSADSEDPPPPSYDAASELPANNVSEM